MKIAYGLAFPDEVTELSIELHCYRHGGGESLGKVYHLTRAWRIAFPEVLPDGSRGYVWSEWTDRRIAAWCGGRFQTWWGPSASGKTEDAAILCLLHWLSAPTETAIHLTSTTAKMLKRRIWGAVVKYYLVYGECVFPGQLKVAENCIVYSPQNLKAGIFGHAVKGGPVDEAVSNIIGIHNTFNVLVIDEMQGTPEAIGSGKVLANLSIGKEFKMLGMGNPMSRLDLLGDFSEPLVGWEKINPGMESWETRRGMCHYFDGLKSPGVLDPDRYPFLLKQIEIDETLKLEGEDSPDWWTMRRGFVPPEGLLPTMISESMLVAGRCFEGVKWGDAGYQIGVGIDPAYSSRGDRCVATPFQWGLDTDGKMKINLLDPIQIQLKLSGDVPMTTFITDSIVSILNELGLDCDSAAMDCSGMQGMMADGVEQKITGRLARIYWGGAVNDAIQVSLLDTRSGKQAYKNRATQLMGHMCQFIKSDMIRGMTKDTALELCRRQLAENVSPIRIESKDEYKARNGHSPDISDSILAGAAFLREIKFIMPEGMRAQPKNVQSRKQKDIDSWEDNFLQP